MHSEKRDRVRKDTVFEFMFGDLCLVDPVNSPASDLQIRRNPLLIHTAGEVDQDRSMFRHAKQVCDVPDG